MQTLEDVDGDGSEEEITEVSSLYNLTSNTFKPVRIREAPFCAGHIYGPTVRPALLLWGSDARAVPPLWHSATLPAQPIAAVSACEGRRAASSLSELRCYQERTSLM